MKQLHNKKGDKVETTVKQGNLAPYRSYSRAEMEAFVSDDTLPQDLFEKTQKEVAESQEKEQKLREAYNHAMEEGGKIGDKLLAKRGLKREDMSEQEIYDTFLDTHKHKP